jgi:hypothetical protein
MIVFVHRTFFGSYVFWYVSYQSLRRSGHTDHDYGWYRLIKIDIVLMASLIDEHGMFIPPLHLIPSQIYSEIFVRPFSDLYLLWDLWDWILSVIFVIPSSIIIASYVIVRYGIGIEAIATYIIEKIATMNCVRSNENKMALALWT